MKDTISKARILKKPDVQSTLASFEIGTPYIIKNREIKPASVRSAIRNLKLRGYGFEYSEKGRVDDVIVTRLK